MELWTQRLKLAISIWGICELYSGQKTVCACMSPFISERLSFTCNGKKINSRVLICSFTVSRNKVMNCYLYQDSSGTVKCWTKSDGWLILLLTFIYIKKHPVWMCSLPSHTIHSDVLMRQVLSAVLSDLQFELCHSYFYTFDAYFPKRLHCLHYTKRHSLVQWGIVST